MLKLKFIAILFCLFILPYPSLARLSIPQGLSSADRESALKILGFGSNFKVLGDPYPLGGYLGVEVGLSHELIATSSIGHLGNGAQEQGDTTYPMITLGKGLYYNVDLFLSFMPLGLGENFSAFGGAARWGIYEMQSLPVHFSLQVSSNFSSFQNKINTTTQTLDVVGGWNFEDIVFFGGVGVIRSSGLFMGGPNGVTDTQETLTENLSQTHSFLGVSMRYEEYFAALQLDRADQVAYAFKLGSRF